LADRLTTGNSADVRQRERNRLVSGTRPARASDTAAVPHEGEDGGQARLSINLSPVIYATLKDYSKRQGITVTEAIRRAISVLKYVDDAQQRGATLNIKEEGNLKEVQFLV
jgi:hypothetical protein